MDRRLVKRKHGAETKNKLSKRSRQDFRVAREDSSDEDTDSSNSTDYYSSSDNSTSNSNTSESSESSGSNSSSTESGDEEYVTRDNREHHFLKAISKLTERDTHIPIPQFTGVEDVEYYIDNARVYIHQFKHLREAKRVSLLRSGISGEARDVLKAYSDKDLGTVSQFYSVLKRMFKKKTKAATKLHQLKQETSEKVRVFAARIRRYVRKIAIQKKINRTCLEFFKAGIRSEFADRLNSSRTKSFEQAVRIASEMEDEKPPIRGKKVVESVLFNANLQHHPPVIPSQDSWNQLLEQQEQRLLALFNKPTEATPNTSGPPILNRFKNLKCFHCQKPGHGYYFCRTANEQDKLQIRNKRMNYKGERKPLQTTPAPQPESDHLNLQAATYHPQKSQH
jgi:hypothetical protein